ncbi:MAG: hypothetical protein CSA81_05025 [Acidobacteria bacterium]|nr:MAG: hypothetical protein CSA81_05025 [Acidobacteriota bacterium]PIE91048.1 MAG: hypothetical protein CR997_02710 [Acidobacteriota bacterium]
MSIQKIITLVFLLLLVELALCVPVFQDNSESATKSMAQGTATQPVTVEHPAKSPEEMMDLAKKAYLDRRFEDCIAELQPLFLQKIPEAMMLTADAWYAKGGPEGLSTAQGIYFRLIYEIPDVPFKDHAYFRIAEIYKEQGNPFEAKLYYRQAVKKFPQSLYVDEMLLNLFKIAENTRNLSDLKKWGETLANNDRNPRNRIYAEYISYIFQNTRKWEPGKLRETFDNNKDRIVRIPAVLQEYAARFKELGLIEEAKEANLSIVNNHSGVKEEAEALLEVAYFEKLKGNFKAAVFLYRLIIEQGKDKMAEAKAMIQLADLMAEGHLEFFDSMGKKWSYSDLLTAIRFSSLKAKERAPFIYRQALLQASSYSPARALLTLRQLISEYKEGPYSALYRDSYKELLHHTILNFYRSERYWELDAIYQIHKNFLEHSTETQYPHMVAKALVEMGLTAPARKVYDAMWREKERVEGFELAFEEPFMDYFMLLNDLRLDDYLKPRLKKYEETSRNEGRYYNRFLLVQTAYESRTEEPLEVVKKAKGRKLFTEDRYDARRLQLLTLAAQEAQDWQYAEELFQAALKWTELNELNPVFARSARIYDADYEFRTGNYYSARKKYLKLRVDPDLDDEERIWADLQLARLYEMQGELKKSLELYGQVALNSIPETEGYASFARRRLSALAFRVEIPEEVMLGQN